MSEKSESEIELEIYVFKCPYCKAVLYQTNESQLIWNAMNHLHWKHRIDVNEAQKIAKSNSRKCICKC